MRKVMRAYHADGGRVFPAYGQVSLSWSADAPLEIQVRGRGQMAGESAVVARDLLAEALDRGQAGVGLARLHMAVPPQGQPRLVVTVDGDLTEFALCPQTARRFLDSTCRRIPLGDEPDLPESADVLAMMGEG